MLDEVFARYVRDLPESGLAPSDTGIVHPAPGPVHSTAAFVRSGGENHSTWAYELSHLRALKAEGIHMMREVAAEFERPCLLFSGGKDSVVMLELALRAFTPGPVPFPVMHVDTGHNFPEVLEFRDRRLAETGARLIVVSVQESIDAGRANEQTGPRPAGTSRRRRRVGCDRVEPFRRGVRRSSS